MVLSTAMVKRLDELAKPLPKDARLRQLIEDVFEPLDYLLGYVAGGIGPPPPRVHHRARNRPGLLVALRAFR